MGGSLLFHTFNSQEQRRKFSGSDFIEIQYCRLDQGSKVKEIISVEAIEHWKIDSLYIMGDDINEFFSCYSKILNCGISNNGEINSLDVFGINYYSQEQSNHIIERIKKEKPQDYQILLDWLSDIDRYIGFYVLGE